jgi:uncharacterized membrane protein YkoI
MTSDSKSQPAPSKDNAPKFNLADGKLREETYSCLYKVELTGEAKEYAEGIKKQIEETSVYSVRIPFTNLTFTHAVTPDNVLGFENISPPLNPSQVEKAAAEVQGTVKGIDIKLDNDYGQTLDQKEIEFPGGCPKILDEISKLKRI